MNVPVATFAFFFFYPKAFEVASRYRDPQPKVLENYSYLFNLRPHIYKSWCLSSHFIPNNSVLIS